MIKERGKRKTAAKINQAADVVNKIYSDIEKAEEDIQLSK